MQTVGQKFAAEREKRGISIRDAAEATKIRADFLSALEEDAYDFELPEIYKRGFVKNYARFLKLDTETLLNDYTAQRSAGTRAASRKGASNDLIGIVDLTQGGERKRAPAAKPDVETSRARENPPVEHVAAGEVDDFREDADHGPGPYGVDKLMLLKVGTIFVAAVLLIIISVVLIQAISGGSGEVVEEPTLTTPGRTTGGGEGTRGPVPEPEELVITAVGSVFVIVDEPSRGVERFRGSLVAGDQRVLTVSIPARIRMTASENLEIEFRGETVTGAEAGVGIVSLP